MMKSWPISNVDVSNDNGSYFPRTRQPTAGESFEVKLTADSRVRATSVWYVVAIEWHHVTEHVCLSAVIWTRSTSYFTHIYIQLNLYSAKIMKNESEALAQSLCFANP